MLILNFVEIGQMKQTSKFDTRTRTRTHAHDVVVSRGLVCALRDESRLKKSLSCHLLSLHVS